MFILQGDNPELIIAGHTLDAVADEAASKGWDVGTLEFAELTPNPGGATEVVWCKLPVGFVGPASMTQDVSFEIFFDLERCCWFVTKSVLTLQGSTTPVQTSLGTCSTYSAARDLVNQAVLASKDMT